MGFAKKALALAAEMEERHEAGKSLYREERVKAEKGKSALSLTFHKSVKKTFKLLEKGGYHEFINDKSKDGENLLNRFSKLILDAERDPGSANAAFKDFDGKTLGHFFYMVNKRAMRDQRTLIPVLKGRCLEAVLERVAELGPSNP